MLNYNARSFTRKEYNEDSYGRTRNYFWVIDGATPINGMPNQNLMVSRYVQLFNQRLESEVSRLSSSDTSLKNLVYRSLKESNVDFSKEFPSFDSDTPTFCLSLVRIRKDSIQIYAIGDCIVDVTTNLNSYLISDPQFSENDIFIENFIANEIKSTGSVEIAYRHLKYYLLNERKKRNTSKGKWILGSINAAALHGYELEIKYNDTERLKSVILYTDGAARYLKYTSSSKFDTYQEAGQFTQYFRKIVKYITEVEEADEDRLIYPRASIHDDITLAQITNAIV